MDDGYTFCSAQRTPRKPSLSMFARFAFSYRDYNIVVVVAIFFPGVAGGFFHRNLKYLQSLSEIGVVKTDFAILPVQQQKHILQHKVWHRTRPVACVASYGVQARMNARSLAQRKAAWKCYT
jgi:hypothetical protein